MATHTITGTRTKPWHITTANDTWVLSEGATFKITNHVPAIDDSPGAGHSDIRILGTLKAPDAYAIDLQTDDNSVLFGANAVVHTSTAAYLSGAGNTIVNHGDIVTTYVALYGGGEGTSFTNSGTVSGYGGFESAQKSAHIVNQAGGLIGGGDAIYLLGTAGTATIDNMGKISGTSTAIVDASTGGATHVTNTGTIHGSVDLGDSNDHFDSHLGTYSSVAGGDGNDTYILGKGQHVTEDAGMGFDTVKSYASATLDAYVDFLTLMGKGNFSGHGNELDNLVYGNKGSNHLFGMGGEDTIGGKAGNDFLTGGAGNDLFVFGKGDQVDTITDYTDGADTIYLKGFSGITSYSDIQSHMSQHGSDVWLSFGHGDKLIVQATTLAELDSTAFSL